jgi:hypothetical protein
MLMYCVFQRWRVPEHSGPSVKIVSEFLKKI